VGEALLIPPSRLRAHPAKPTPPTNTPIDTNRRRFLTVAAGASVASVGTLAVAAAPATAPESAACAPDPIFAAIERHRELSAHYDAAVSISAHLPCGPDFEAAEEITAERCHALLEHADALIRSEPTTIAGVIGLTRYVGSLEEWQTPADRCDMWEASWHRAFLGTLANALDKIGVRG
jgi:hypothetical protein